MPEYSYLYMYIPLYPRACAYVMMCGRVYVGDDISYPHIYLIIPLSFMHHFLRAYISFMYIYLTLSVNLAYSLCIPNTLLLLLLSPLSPGKHVFICLSSL